MGPQERRAVVGGAGGGHAPVSLSGGGHSPHLVMRRAGGGRGIGGHGGHVTGGGRGYGHASTM